jgi:hypothetical protein
MVKLDYYEISVFIVEMAPATSKSDVVELVCYRLVDFGESTTSVEDWLW